MKSDVCKAVMLFVVMMCVEAMAGHLEEAMARLNKDIKEDLHLQELLEEQLRISASARKRITAMEEKRKAMEASRMVLEEKLKELEDEAADLQRMMNDRPTMVREMELLLNKEVTRSINIRRDQETKLDASLRRHCEVLTEGRGQLSMLCRGAGRFQSPTLTKFLEALEQQYFQDENNNNKFGGGRSFPLLRLMVLWVSFAATIKVLWRSKNRNCKED